MLNSKSGPLAPALAGLLLLGALSVGAGPVADKKVGVMWVAESGMADRVARGFAQRMQELAPDVELEFARALADDAAAEPVYARFQAEKDGVLFLGPAGARWLAANPPRVPSFIGAANNPERLGVVKDMDHPDGRVTGVTDYLPIARQFELYRQLFPELKRVALLTMEGHPGSAGEEEGTRAACAALGIDCQVSRSAGKHDLVKAVKALRDDADLFILGDQSLLIDNSAVVATLAGGTPIMSYSEQSVGRGALGGLVPDDTKLGGMLAESVCAVLLEGESVAAVPVKTDPRPRFLVDAKKLAELGLTLPPALAELAEEI